MREAATLPLRIRLKKRKKKKGTEKKKEKESKPTAALSSSSSSTSTSDEAELTVVGPLDSGGRGRPRVTADVTAALASLGLDVVSADVYVDEGCKGSGGGGSGSGGESGGESGDGGGKDKRRRASREVHRFVLSSSSPFSTSASAAAPAPPARGRPTSPSSDVAQVEEQGAPNVGLCSPWTCLAESRQAQA